MSEVGERRPGAEGPWRAETARTPTEGDGVPAFLLNVRYNNRHVGKSVKLQELSRTNGITSELICQPWHLFSPACPSPRSQHRLAVGEKRGAVCSSQDCDPGFLVGVHCCDGPASHTTAGRHGSTHE